MPSVAKKQHFLSRKAFHKVGHIISVLNVPRISNFYALIDRKAEILTILWRYCGFNGVPGPLLPKSNVNATVQWHWILKKDVIMIFQGSISFGIIQKADITEKGQYFQ